MNLPLKQFLLEGLRIFTISKVYGFCTSEYHLSNLHFCECWNSVVMKYSQSTDLSVHHYNYLLSKQTNVNTDSILHVNSIYSSCYICLQRNNWM